MKTRIGATVLTVLLAFCGAVDARPPDYTIGFNLHKTIGDPTSPIDFTVTMGLMIEAQDGDSIGWDVVVITIREVDLSGNAVETWSKTNPFVNTADGLWWIEHADPDDPVDSEFLVPPRIADTASHVNPTEPSLEFEIEGNIYVAPPGGAPFDTTASLDTVLSTFCVPGICGCPPDPPCDPPPPPKKDERDEPVEAPNDPSEPYPT